MAAGRGKFVLMLQKCERFLSWAFCAAIWYIVLMMAIVPGLQGGFFMNAYWVFFYVIILSIWIFAPFFAFTALILLVDIWKNRSFKKSYGLAKLCGRFGTLVIAGAFFAIFAKGVLAHAAANNANGLVSAGPVKILPKILPEAIPEVLPDLLPDSP